MFQESPSANPVKTSRRLLAAVALREGAKTVKPRHLSYGYSNEGCALCALATGLGLPTSRDLLAKNGVTRDNLNKVLGDRLIDEIEAKFEGWPFNGQNWADRNPKHSFAEIIEWLES